MLRIRLILVFLSFIFFSSFVFGDEVRVSIRAGMNTHQIAKLLKEKSVIKHKNFFLLLARLGRIDSKLQAGNYSFESGSSVFKVLSVLKKGRENLVKVTIPEGFTAKEVATRLVGLGLGDFDKYMTIIDNEKLEGYLFPETYFFSPSWDEKAILNEMKEEFEFKTADLFKDFKEKVISRRIKLDKREIIIVASLVEEEAKIPSERPFIAAVFYNRLKKSWYLNSCATVQYALGKTKKRLLYEDLKIDSPYNTYINKGLPPGPICNPGLDSIKAAMNPEKTDVLFFVRNKELDGTHTFSKHFNSHLKAKRKNIN